MIFVDLLVHAPQEADGFDIFLSAVLVGNPLAVLARVVEIEHGGDGVDAQTVDVIPVEPEKSVAD